MDEDSHRSVANAWLRREAEESRPCTACSFNRDSAGPTAHAHASSHASMDHAHISCSHEMQLIHHTHHNHTHTASDERGVCGTQHTEVVGLRRAPFAHVGGERFKIRPVYLAGTDIHSVIFNSLQLITTFRVHGLSRPEARSGEA